MGSGNAKTDNTDLKYLRFQTKDDDNPHFGVRKKNPANGKIEDQEPITWFDGWLIEVKMGVYTPKDNSPPRPTIIMFFKDGDDVMKLETGFSMMARTLINSLANLDKLGKLKISLYTASKNGKANIWIECDGEACKWKYDWENDQKPLIHEYDMGEGQIGKNYSKLNEFFTKVLMEEVKVLVVSQDSSVWTFPEKDELLEAVKESEAKSEEEETDIPKPDSAAPDLPVIEEEDDDLPF